jgi:hypothetical protein
VFVHSYFAENPLIDLKVMNPSFLGGSIIASDIRDQNGLSYVDFYMRWTKLRRKHLNAFISYFFSSKKNKNQFIPAYAHLDPFLRMCNFI